MDYELAQALAQGFRGAGDAAQWGMLLGAGGSNPAIMPSVLQGMFQQQNQPRVWQEERNRYLGNMIMQGVADGSIGWEHAGPALEKLGFNTRGLPPDLFGGIGAPMASFNQQLQDFWAGDGQEGQVPSTQAFPGLQRSALAPPDTVPPAEPPTPEATAQAYGAAQAPPESLTKIERDESGAPHVKALPGAPSADITSHFTPGEQQQYEEQQAIMRGPRLTNADITRFIIKSGAKGKAQQMMFARGQQLLKEDQERRDLAVKQSKTLIEAAQQRMTETGEKPIEVATGGKDPNTGEALYQTMLLDKYGKMRKIGEVHPYHAGVQVTTKVGPFDTKAAQLTADQLIGEKGQAEIDGARHTIASLDDMQELNKQGIIGGAFAEPRTWWANMMAPFATKDELDKLSRSAQYESDLKGLLLEKMKSRDLGSGTAISNQDREFVMQMLPRASWDIHARTAIVATMRHYAQYKIDDYMGKQAYVQDQLKRGVDNPNLIGYAGSKFQPKLTSYVSTPEAKNLKATLGDVPATQQPKASSDKAPLDWGERKGWFAPAAPIEQR